MDIINNDKYYQLARNIQTSARDYHNAQSRLEAIKMQLAEFVVLNAANIASIDLSAYTDQISEYESEMRWSKESFDEAKAGLVKLISNLSL